MLIIFDLDDTLIDTSFCITPVKLEQALRAVAEAGWVFVDFKRKLQELLEYNEQESSAGKALEVFFFQEKIPEKFLHVAKNVVYNTLPEDIDICAVEGALAVLKDLKKNHDLAIVSVGNALQQRFKLKKAGIDTALFYKIFLVEEGSKQRYYQMLKDELNISFSDVLVCGDRIEGDLLPAKELGCVTVHMKRGRGKKGNAEMNGIDFTITKLSQLQEIIEKITNKS